MEKLNRKLLVLALFMALITSLLIYFYLSGISSRQVKITTVGMYTAKVDIPARTVVTDAMIMEVQIPENITLPKGLKSKNEIVGKMTKDKIIRGEPILAERLYSDDKTSMAYTIPEGKRAVTIGVNEVSEVADFIEAGDCVDIIATFDEKDKDLGKTKVFYPKLTKTVLQNVQILGIGQSMEVERKDDKKLPVSVTLAVTPAEAEKLVLADESGVLRLALRPAAEQGQVRTDGVVRDDLMPAKGKMEVSK